MKNFYALVGPAGAGKCTLANELACRYDLELARVYIDKEQSIFNAYDYEALNSSEYSSLLKEDSVLFNVTTYGTSFAMTTSQYDACDFAVLPLAGVKKLRADEHKLSKHIKMIYITASLESRVNNLRDRKVPDSDILDYLCIDSKLFADIDPDHLVKTDTNSDVFQLSKTIHDYIVFEEWRS